MVHSVSIKPFQRKKDDRNYWLPVLKKHAGVDQCKCQLDKSEEYVNSNI